MKILCWKKRLILCCHNIVMKMHFSFFNFERSSDVACDILACQRFYTFVWNSRENISAGSMTKPFFVHNYPVVIKSFKTMNFLGAFLFHYYNIAVVIKTDDATNNIIQLNTGRIQIKLLLHCHFCFSNFWFRRTKFQNMKTSFDGELMFSPKSGYGW